MTEPPAAVAAASVANLPNNEPEVNANTCCPRLAPAPNPPNILRPGLPRRIVLGHPDQCRDGDDPIVLGNGIKYIIRDAPLPILKCWFTRTCAIFAGHQNTRCGIFCHSIYFFNFAAPPTFISLYWPCTFVSSHGKFMAKVDYSYP